MITFPEIRAPSYPIGMEVEDNSLRSNFEDGSMQSRVKFTRSRAKYTLKWNSLPQDEYEILYEFITKKSSIRRRVLPGRILRRIKK